MTAGLRALAGIGGAEQGAHRGIARFVPRFHGGEHGLGAVEHGVGGGGDAGIMFWGGEACSLPLSPRGRGCASGGNPSERG